MMAYQHGQSVQYKYGGEWITAMYLVGRVHCELFGTHHVIEYQRDGYWFCHSSVADHLIRPMPRVAIMDGDIAPILEGGTLKAPNHKHDDEQDPERFDTGNEL